MSWHGGFFNIWEILYPTHPVTTNGFLSQTFINYGSLLGLTYIIARESALSKSAVKGWSLGIVMLLMTYLLPGNLIIHLMNKINDNISLFARYPVIITLIGLGMAASIIITEAFILSRFKKKIESFGKLILQFPTFF